MNAPLGNFSRRSDGIVWCAYHSTNIQNYEVAPCTRAMDHVLDLGHCFWFDCGTAEQVYTRPRQTNWMDRICVVRCLYPPNIQTVDLNGPTRFNVDFFKHYPKAHSPSLIPTNECIYCMYNIAPFFLHTPCMFNPYKTEKDTKWKRGTIIASTRK